MNMDEILKVYRAAEMGNADAQIALGLAYHEGLGVEKDSCEAARWWKKAAEQGDAKAQMVLGDCYWKGDGVEQDYSEAVRWYREAAEQGLAEAQLSVGNAYVKGLGVEEDDYEAVQWWVKAAEQGNAKAQGILMILAKEAVRQSKLGKAFSAFAEGMNQSDPEASEVVRRSMEEAEEDDSEEWDDSIFETESHENAVSTGKPSPEAVAAGAQGGDSSSVAGQAASRQPREQGNAASGKGKNTRFNLDKESGKESGKTAGSLQNAGAHSNAAAGVAADTFCRMCGTQIPAGGGFCPKCGAPVNGAASAPSAVFCRMCGTQIPAGGGFCPKCGAPVNASAAGAPQYGGMPGGNYGWSGSPAAQGGMYSDMRYPLFSLKGWFAFKGRMGRREWWNRTCMMIGITVGFVMPAISNAGGFGTSGNGGIATFALVLLLLMSILNLCFSVRRMHDMNLSGWWMLLVTAMCMFIPALPSVIWLGCVPGTKGPNRFGPDPVNNANQTRR
jgi:uncharacterized membrane protein YhaH (DUF805 family)